MKLVITAEAKADLFRERDYYEGEREGLGERFVHEMRTVITRIEQRPLGFPAFEGTSSRRALGKRFPFMVVFLIEREVIYVTAVVHQHSDPESYRNS